MTHRRSSPPTSSTPARLALSLNDPGSSGLIDVADLRAEPLPWSLVSAGLTSTPPPTTEAPRRRSWPLAMLGSVMALALGGLATVVALQPTPTIVVERPVAVERQLSMQDVEAPPAIATVAPDEDDAPPAEIIAAAEAEAKAEAEAEAKAEAKSTAPAKQRRTTTRTTKRSSSSSSSKSSSSTPATTPPSSSSSARDTIAVECVLDPTRCSASGATKTSGSTTTGTSTKPRPAKLSVSQLKQALATTKASARACGPTHGVDSGTKVRIKLSIDGDTGSVVSSTAQGEHAGTSLGTCVATALGRTTFPQFTAGRMGTLYSVIL